MTQFWIICAGLLLLALLFVVLPLWRSKVRNNDVERNAANLEIFRDQIAEMDADLRNGLLTQELYEQGKKELQARLLEEANPDAAAPSLLKRNPHKVLAVVLAVVLPTLSFGLYQIVGNKNAFLPQVTHGTAEGFGEVRSESAIKALEEKVSKKQDDPEAMLLLARSYNEMERFAEAAATYEKLTKLVPNEAGLWADYADALAMANGQTLIGEPTKLLDKALKLDPNNPKALALAGSGAMERGDYPVAIRHWENLLKQMPKDSEDAKMIQGGIQQARDFMAQLKSQGKSSVPAPQTMQAAPTGGAERISGVVELSDAVKMRASPDDTVFVLAKAAQGPQMPLAVIRKQVRDLPLRFELNDGMAMSPQMKISDFPQIVVIARVSKSGSAMAQPGDLQGVSQPLKPGTADIKVVIDREAK
jgi:cytochrome c-type biogenesis protein CcmH